ncbi:type I-F CRISPR-associated endoribonuclease Cas6/Csy4 [Pseudoalteromonas xiamenensis]|uniref:type I-F CRISPR-associated endoribonuclease Cas6/Csy4 n=1 Tax=Pseudoalteromonas xiamenensis TaxID=882626 RepID=UPI0027E55A8D|nr:type I-F CRISPR-associated endoribonuclease Cas6/Csy4 [Pseudoalteromonas xiamenensis]WMN59558.1 type I-F CRISPR-associated endoribonuclease Cas6/Csy4 [Pseudoalteromonas xiamenensis]
MSRSYFTITYLPKNCDVTLLAGRCIGILHGFMNKQSCNHIGVSFPKWTDKDLGNQIAFVSEDKAALKYLSQQNYFEMMAHDKLFEISAIKPVPVDTPEVRIIRDQSLGKLCMGEKRRRMERAKRRAEARGEEYTPQYVPTDTEISAFHKIPIASKNNQNDFVLHLRLEPTDSIQSTFNSYGFATNEVYKGSVPVLAI